MKASLLVVVVASALGTLSCGNSTEPDLRGAPFFSASVDGIPWSPDTAGAILFGLSPDQGSLSLFAGRLTSTQEQDIYLSITTFPATGSLVVADASAPVIGAFGVITLGTGMVPPPIVTYVSTSLHPGTLNITALSQPDSTLTGTFAFETATVPDTAPHHTLTGRFRLRYTFQQVFPPAGH